MLVTGYWTAKGQQDRAKFPAQFFLWNYFLDDIHQNEKPTPN
jgi:hypothetical protein